MNQFDSWLNSSTSAIRAKPGSLRLELTVADNRGSLAWFSLMLLLVERTGEVSFGEVTLRTSPSSGQATTKSQLRHLQLLACHSREALDEAAAQQIGRAHV